MSKTPDPCPHRVQNGRCACKPGCAHCGHGEHAGIHMPAFGAVDSWPLGHFYAPRKKRKERRQERPHD